MGSLGLDAGLFRVPLSTASRRLRSYLSASAAISFSSRLRLLFSATDLSWIASVCCVRRRSILPSSRRFSAENSEVSDPDAMRSAKAAAWHKDCQSGAMEAKQSQKHWSHSHVSTVAQLRRHVLRSGGRGNFTVDATLGPRIQRGPLRHDCHDHQTSHHRRRDNNQLLGLRSYTMVKSEMQASRKKRRESETHQQEPVPCGRRTLRPCP